MEKKVNIVANVPVRSIKPMIYGCIYGEMMTTEKIFACICGKAIVDEVLPDGTLVRLGLDNYNTDNGGGVVPAVENDIAAPVPETPAVAEPELSAAPAVEDVPVPVDVIPDEAKPEEAPAEEAPAAPVEEAAPDTAETVEEVKPAETPKKKNNNKK